ncbi:heme exporter protein CcmD [Hyphococcus flavus]|uniref:Heme exporter protein D n=1 Tax=Hyphococcus flavus TaxID=1866326 RepID=A0AAF0CE78_9PROT|nr:heme exporter protein CcmD [Hyphococcus flavus]WDI30866.1 heme exporter protein CcmD [Hyphococcus flavus]
MDFGSHTPYILAAYGASILVLGGLITLRVRWFRNVMKKEKNSR